MKTPHLISLEFAEDMEEQLPTGHQSTRSNMLTGTESRQSAIEKVQQILGGEDIVAKPQESKQISASELLGGVPESRPAEDKKISVDQLFSSSMTNRKRRRRTPLQRD